MNEAANNGAHMSARTLVQRAAQREEELRRNASSDAARNDADSISQIQPLKPDHVNRPCWITDDGFIFLEAFHSLYRPTYEFLIAIAEPVSRPKSNQIHQYKLTPFSLYAAVATLIETEEMIAVLERLSKNKVPPRVNKFIRDCTQNYGKAKLVLKNTNFYIESKFSEVLRELLHDPTIAQARVADYRFGCDGGFRSMQNSDEEVERQTLSFKINAEAVPQVKQRANELDFPLMEEYDYKNDRSNPNVPNLELKPQLGCGLYEHQTRSLEKMFGNGRARSGIIVLPCGAGKTRTGVTAAQTIKKSVVCLCTNVTSVQQWKEQFQLWTTISDENIVVFTADHRNDRIPEGPCVLITTYAMMGHGGKRAEITQRILDAIASREWGLLLLDEVHVAPAATFRRVIGFVKAHCRLGLTATLVREDDLIKDLNFLVGPKLYEANWMDLTAQGYLANVQCVEVRCPMVEPFMEQYLRTSDARLKELLYIMNPNKLRVVEYLVRFHEKRGDKIILFSDRVCCLMRCAEMLQRPMIYGKTKEFEREVILREFRSNDKIQTICLSRVGDAAIDLPGANVIIQVSFHAGAQRQEAQRLGRILRPKPCMSGSSRPSFDAFFYTLVSTETQEVEFASKRQQYLIDQGYTYKVLPNLCEEAAGRNAVENGNEFTYATPQDDIKLLQSVLNMTDD